MKKKIICFIFGHKYWYLFPGTPICERCKYIPPINTKEYSIAEEKMNENFRKSCEK